MRPNNRSKAAGLHATLDESELATFRTRVCEQHRNGSCKNADRCPHSHCQTWQRRNPAEYAYSSKLCPEIEFVKRDSKMTLVRRCSRGRGCCFAHSKEEELYHPTMYKTKMCNSYPYCTRYYCPFAHSAEELRKPGKSGSVSRVSTKPSVTSCEGINDETQHQRQKQEEVRYGMCSRPGAILSEGIDNRALGVSGVPSQPACETTRLWENYTTAPSEAYATTASGRRKAANAAWKEDASGERRPSFSDEEHGLPSIHFAGVFTPAPSKSEHMTQGTLQQCGVKEHCANGKLRCPESPMSSSTTASSIPSPVLASLSPASKSMMNKQREGTKPSTQKTCIEAFAILSHILAEQQYHPQDLPESLKSADETGTLVSQTCQQACPMPQKPHQNVLGGLDTLAANVPAMDLTNFSDLETIPSKGLLPPYSAANRAEVSASFAETSEMCRMIIEALQYDPQYLPRSDLKEETFSSFSCDHCSSTSEIRGDDRQTYAVTEQLFSALTASLARDGMLAPVASDEAAVQQQQLSPSPWPSPPCSEAANTCQKGELIAWHEGGCFECSTLSDDTKLKHLAGDAYSPKLQQFEDSSSSVSFFLDSASDYPNARTTYACGESMTTRCNDISTTAGEDGHAPWWRDAPTHLSFSHQWSSSPKLHSNFSQSMDHPPTHGLFQDQWVPEQQPQLQLQPKQLHTRKAPLRPTRATERPKFASLYPSSKTLGQATVGSNAWWTAEVLDTQQSYQWNTAQ